MEIWIPPKVQCWWNTVLVKVYIHPGSVNIIKVKWEVLVLFWFFFFFNVGLESRCLYAIWWTSWNICSVKKIRASQYITRLKRLSVVQELFFFFFVEVVTEGWRNVKSPFSRTCYIFVVLKLKGSLDKDL